jgi:ribosomal protein S18 acetylase RimI-like enzyme
MTTTDVKATENRLMIRGARDEDIPALAALLGELGYPASPDVIGQRLHAMLDAGELVLIAIRESEALGVVTVHVTPVLHRPTSVGRITALVVTRRARGEGVGRALVDVAERLLAQRGCALIEVTSNQRRADAHAFYVRLGYEVTSLRFKKELPPATTQD